MENSVIHIPLQLLSVFYASLNIKTIQWAAPLYLLSRFFNSSVYG